MFSTTTFKKEEYRITCIEGLYLNIWDFLDRRVAAQYENHGYLFETNENIIKVKFYHPDYAANYVEFTLFRVECYLVSRSQLDYNKNFFNKEFFKKWEDCPYEIHIIEIATIKQEEDEEEDYIEPVTQDTPPQILESFRSDKCVICLENDVNIFYDYCRHIPTCRGCEETHPIN